MTFHSYSIANPHLSKLSKDYTPILVRENRVVTWEVRGSLPIDLVDFAVTLISKYCNVKFEWDSVNPDIVLTFEGKYHTLKIGGKEQCSGVFNNPTDDPDDLTFRLAHIMTVGAGKLAIHINKDLNWQSEFKPVESEYQFPLYQVILHELLHAIGFKHSSDPSSILFKELIYKAHDYVFDGILLPHDIQLLQKLHGAPPPETDNQGKL